MRKAEMIEVTAALEAYVVAGARHGAMRAAVAAGQRRAGDAEACPSLTGAAYEVLCARLAETVGVWASASLCKAAGNFVSRLSEARYALDFAARCTIGRAPNDAVNETELWHRAAQALAQVLPWGTRLDQELAALGIGEFDTTVH